MDLPLPPSNARPAGYLRLAERYGARTIPYWHELYVSTVETRASFFSEQRSRHILPAAQWPGETDYEHLRFALKHEGLNLPLLRVLLPKFDPAELAREVALRPTGPYPRRIWFLYEAITTRILDLPDAPMGNYVPLIEPGKYFTGPVRRAPRQRIAVNLLGDPGFCVMVRRSPELVSAVGKDFAARCRKVVGEFPPEIFQRALDFLYRKETRSSFAIERETPDQRRADEFVRLLREADRTDYLSKPALVTLQNAIVEPRYVNRHGWRDAEPAPDNQNFVAGQGPGSIDGVHHIPPRPQELGALMDGWFAASRLMLESDLHPVIAAAAIAWTFVFLHPFSDGNGRIHRFLIHHVLACRGFGPQGVIFPVSAAMLDEMRAYDASLEEFSQPLLRLVDWMLDENRHLHVRHDSSDFYRAIDCTRMAEALFRFVERTIERDLPAELTFLRGYDSARAAMREVVEMPGPDADRFIQFCKQNGWRLSAAKRHTGGLAKLTDDEITRLEAVVRKAFVGEQDA